ncbi:MAG TPA: hypothetical protein VJT67_16415 [Longimicrobiaceae bacterium]|nr:hypothetical protein [Longimicrobiaceae bacterium]
MKRKLARSTMVLLAALSAVAGPATIVRAQDEVIDPGGGCTWTTRWKDIHGVCQASSCCDSTQYSCPCTV